MTLIETVMDPTPGRERRRERHSNGHLPRRDAGLTSHRAQQTGRSSSLLTQPRPDPPPGRDHPAANR
ncbi:hypothetical protein, partial [Streptomyces sp. MK37H]|uniref:hypothetical protein n=1 Tax=Streptomyces sp. MK37H TaxID=2699117 RepID=UPI001B39BD21